MGGSDELSYITSLHFTSDLHVQLTDHCSLQTAHTPSQYRGGIEGVSTFVQDTVIHTEDYIVSKPQKPKFEQ
jgi:hypothetical protein